MRNITGIVFYGLLLTGIFATAQEFRIQNDSIIPEQLEEVIVAATRTVNQLSSLPLPAQIIGKQEIQSINAQRLSDLLSEQTGLLTVPDYGGGEGIQLQGLDAQYTLILIDGVPLIGRSAGTLDLNRISVGNIRQIEVVKGASSSLYGSEALGGVINIITKTPKQGFGGNISHRYSTFATHDTGAELRFKKNKTGISAFINRFGSKGYDLSPGDALNTVEPYQNYTLSTRIDHEFTEAITLTLSGRYFTQNQDNNADENLSGESRSRDWNTHLLLQHTFNSKWTTDMEFYATRYTAREFLDAQDGSRFSDTFFKQLFLRPEIRVIHQPNKKNTFMGGIGFGHETADRTDFYTQPVFNAPYAYLQYEGHPTKRLNLIAGARFDSHSNYRSQFSPKAAVRYRISSKLAVKGSVGYGFKAPDFRQLYFNFTNATVGYTILGHDAVPDIIPQLEAEGQLANIVVSLSDFEGELRPENSVSVNLGMDYVPVSGLKLQLNLFQNHIKNLIDTRIIASKINGQNVFSYYNVNNVYTRGVEWNASWKPSNRIRVSGGYQLLFALDKNARIAFRDGNVFAKETPESPAFRLDTGDYYGLYNRSRHMANLKVFYTVPKWDFNANIRSTYRSRYGLSDTNGNTYLDRYDDFVAGHAIWDVAMNKTIAGRYTLALGADNIFNFTNPANIPNIPGRILYGKLTVQF